MKHCHHFTKENFAEIEGMVVDQEECCNCGDVRWVPQGKGFKESTHKMKGRWETPNCEWGRKVVNK